MRTRYQWQVGLLWALLQVRNLGATRKKVGHVRRASRVQEANVVQQSYGVDVSFPMHHEWFSLEDDPIGNSQKLIYANFMGGCREAYPEVEEMCDVYEKERIEMNMRQPATLQNFTETGYKKIRAPPELWKLLKKFWDSNDGKENKERWSRGRVLTNHWSSPTFLLDVGDKRLHGGGESLVKKLHEAARPTMEDWSGKALTPTHLYGIRIYTEGSILSPHVDGVRKDVSAVVNVAQDVEEPWILELIDLQGKAQNITMEPGDMVLYESRTVIHGRPYPLRGEFFANAFLHFEPTIQYFVNFDEEEAEERAEDEAEKEAETLAHRIEEQFLKELEEFDDDYESDEEER